MDIGEAFVVSEVEVCFASVHGNEDLTVLVGRHSAWVHVEVRVAFQQGDVEAAIFEHSAERSDGDTFTERTYNAARYENGVGHQVVL